MELEFKPDIAETQARWTAFWKGEHLERPLLSIVLPKPGVEPIEKPAYTAGADGDFEPVIDQLLAWAATHEFLGEAIPFFYLEFCPDHFSSLLGGDIQFLPNSSGTSWLVPFVDDWDAAEIKFQRDSFWWQRTAAFARALRARCDGKLLIAAPTLVAGLDCLAAIRGTQELMLDMALRPDKIKTALQAVNAAHTEILDALSVELGYDEFGSINRHGMYCRDKISVPQCDCSTMISPRMFQEFQVPCLVHEMQNLDAVEYHLDGPGALKHLPALCEIDEIDVIQWVPGSGEAEKKDWTELYQEIDTRGKGQILWVRDHDQIRHIWDEFQSRKLFFVTSASSVKEAEDLIRSFK